ncbi:TonB-dependent receptor [Hymenobacter sp. UV11]|uniref:SusC/RagA family TonB-linked outer membrane protein n=1 Tax=Hymenobacter sp. UV11 TaxID=1849735 RepID=UPI00105CF549|nr:TonB-dependent receptor [Hymenobacter sp. UV11]TDN37392.1 SusC/RagA family TonB-linked outer membrane protein [Hymenobacter sp. UV11]TFZ68579.1 TonB-dependent receptor [Hymenobacter sp. UV11]
MRNIFTPLLVMAALPALAQTQVVNGRVTGTDGSPVPGATIVERGTTNGVTSNADGGFSLSVKPGSTLVISSVGFAAQTIPVSGRSRFDVVLQNSTTDLAEAVVVGYGTQTKADLTGSVAQLTSKDVGDQPVQSFEQSIQGKAAGVFIENSSGKLGQGIRVRVRGVSSISGSSQPLYVVDGVPVVADNLSSTTAATNPIADINPNDIESISVLKDASSSAIYGSRATNGVVLITTKRGKAGGTRFNVGIQGGFNEPTHKRDFLNSQEYVMLLTEALVNRGTTFAVPANIATRLSGYAGGVADPLTYDTNWQDQVLQRAGFQQYDLNASGGTEKTRFYFSGQYSKQKGIIVSNQYERIASRFNLDHQATDRLSFGLNLTATRSVNNRLPNDNAFSTPMQIVALAPITPLIDPRSGQVSGALDPTTGLPNTGFPFYYNPLLSIQGGSYVTTVYRLLGNVYAQLKLTKGLIFRSELGTDVLNQNEEQYLGRVTSRNTGNTNGYGFNTNQTNAKVIVNNYFSYKNTFAENHSLELTLGTSYESARISGNSVTGTQFASDSYRTLDNAAQITAGSSFTTSYALVSYFARAAYAFQGKYLVGGSARLDGSSRFGAERRYGIFPAGSIGWLISEEDFLKGNTTLSLLKVRASLGKTGNQNFGNFASRNLFAGNAGYAGTPGQRPYQLGNDVLGWESTVQYDAGLEYGLFNNRISGEVDIYRKNTTGLLLSQPVPGTSGFSVRNANVGSLRNQGLELTLTTRNFVGDFTWTTSVNASVNQNKILDLAGPDILGSFLNRAQAGQPLGEFIGPEYAGVDPANGNALYYLNSTNADGTLNRGTTTNINLATNVPIGNPNPRWTGGITNTFTYKGFDLTATLIGVFGNQIYDGAAPFFSVGFNNGYDNQTRDQLNRWQKPGDITNVPKAIYGGGNGTGQSSRFVQNGDYGRLRSVVLGYNLPSSLAKRGFLQSARLFVQGYNLLTFTKYTGWDPEVSTDYTTGTNNTTSNNISQGISFYTAPQARTYTVGLNLGF